MVAEDGTVFVCGCGNNTIYQISPTGETSPFVTGGFNCVNGISKDNSNGILVSNFSDGVITKITKNGERSVVGDTGVGNGHLVYRSVDQMIYIASYSGNRIFRMDLDGNVSVFAGTGQPGKKDADDLLQATFTRPNGITLSKDKCSMYITQDENVIREIKFFDGRCDPPSSIQDLSTTTAIKLYPNPSSGIIQIDNPDNLPIVTIKLFDMLGKEVLKFDKINHHLDVSKLPKGAYSLILSTEDKKQYRKKIILQ